MSDEERRTTPAPVAAVPGVPGVTDGADGPGTTRFHLLGNPTATTSARDLVRGWCRDRAVPSQAADRLVVIVQTATRLALERHPRRIAVGLRWLDPDRVILDVRSKGCTATRPSGSRTGRRPSHTSPLTSVFDIASQGWGSRLRATESVQWFLVDTTAT